MNDRDAAPDHRGVLKELDPHTLSALTARSDAKGALQLATHVGALIFTSFILITQAMPLWWLALPAQGVLLVFLFCAQHECIHDTAFATRPINRAVASVIGFVLFLPARWFRYFHFAHHAHTQDSNLDPELLTPKPATRREYLWMMTGIPVSRSLNKAMMESAIGDARPDYIPEAKYRGVVNEARLTLAGYASLVVLAWIYGWSHWLLMLWIVPLILGQPFLRGFLLAEHALCAQNNNMLDNTRTTVTNAIVRWLGWQMSYHAEHHAHAGVPFHALGQLHTRTQDHLSFLTPGYIAFHRSYWAQLKPNS